MLSKTLRSEALDLELRGNRFLSSAMRSIERAQFEIRIRQAQDWYRKSVLKLSRALEPSPELHRCRARLAYAQFFAARSQLNKRRFIADSWRHCVKALAGFEKSRMHAELGTTYAELGPVGALLYEMTWEPKTRQRILREAVEFGRSGIIALTGKPESTLFARVSVQTALFLDALLGEGCDIDRHAEIKAEAQAYWKKAVETSRNTAVLATSRPPAGFFAVIDFEESVKVWEEAINPARKSRDNFAISWLCDQLAGAAFWNAQGSENPHDSIEFSKAAVRYCEEASERYSKINFTSPNDGILWPHSPYAEHFLQLSWYEVDREKQRRLVEKGYHETKQLLVLANRSHYAKIIAYAHHITSKVAHELAEFETRTAKKKRLLREALAHRQLACDLLERFQPRTLWARGVYLRYLSDVKAGLASVEEDKKVKVELLSHAVEYKRNGLELCEKYVNAIAKGKTHILLKVLGGYKLDFGSLLMTLYRESDDLPTLQLAAATYAQAYDLYKDSTKYSRSAESCFKAAQAYDEMSAHSSASHFFDLASKTYKKALRRIPHLGQFYRDYAKYFETWSLIESARAFDSRLEYSKSAECYRRASRVHRSSSRWSSLASRDLALANLESAEELSREGRHEDSLDKFKEAVRLFEVSIPSTERPRVMPEWPQNETLGREIGPNPRLEYCRARILIEEANIDGNAGDHRSGSEKFRRASQILEDATKKTTSLRDKTELSFIATLSQGWHLMSKAIADSKQELFSSASELFSKAARTSQDEHRRFLAVGHAELSDGLRVLSEFSIGLDTAGYHEALKRLSLAVKHFSLAGYKRISELAGAYRLLLEAEAEIAIGDNHSRSETRARHYSLGRNFLQEAARAFVKAGQLDKARQVERLHLGIEGGWKTSSTVAELSMLASRIPSAQVALASRYSPEKPDELSRLSGPDIETTFTVSPLKGNGGLYLELVLAIANTGNQPIRLARVESVVPERVKVFSTPENTRLDGRSLLLSPKRVDPVKSEELRIVIHPQPGFPRVLKPRIVFIDPQGVEHYRDLTTRIIAETPILEFLVGAFSSDHDSKRLGVEFSGWRSFVEISSRLNIPRSHLYGEPRYGRKYGKQLENLIVAGLVETRLFPGERGRGGEIEKARVSVGNPLIQQLLYA